MLRNNTISVSCSSKEVANDHENLATANSNICDNEATNIPTEQNAAKKGKCDISYVIQSKSSSNFFVRKCKF